MNTKQLRTYFPRNWEFGSALSKLRNLGTPLRLTAKYVCMPKEMQVPASQRSALPPNHLSAVYINDGFLQEAHQH
jgi:hypothetical protein